MICSALKASVLRQLRLRDLLPRPSDRRRGPVAHRRQLATLRARSHLPIDHFDGLDTFDDLPRDGRCVADMWF
jgi:hypothetical protein